MRYRAVLFDLDGTLTDPFEGITKSVEHALDRCGIKVANRRELACFIGPPLHESFMKYYGFTEPEAFRAVEVYREYFSVTGLFENKVYPGIPELLAELSDGGIKLAVATSKPTVFAKRILDHFGLTGYFSVCVGSELDGRRVRKDEVIADTLSALGIGAPDAVMVGDRMHDVIGAKKNGVAAVGVTYGYGTREELTEAGAFAVADTVDELKEILTS